MEEGGTTTDPDAHVGNAVFDFPPLPPPVKGGPFMTS